MPWLWTCLWTTSAWSAGRGAKRLAFQRCGGVDVTKSMELGSACFLEPALLLLEPGRHRLAVLISTCQVGSASHPKHSETDTVKPWPNGKTMRPLTKEANTVNYSLRSFATLPLFVVFIHVLSSLDGPPSRSSTSHSFRKVAWGSQAFPPGLSNKVEASQ